MALNIRNQETERLTNELVRLTGETKTQAITQAVAERIERVKREKHKRCLADELDQLALECSTLPVIDNRPMDVILGYGETGVPS